MTNEELLEEINDSIVDIAFHKVKSVYPYLAALRSVVELHKPMPAQFKEGAISCFECSTMDHDVYWDDCSTIKAIKGELND